MVNRKNQSPASVPMSPIEEQLSQTAFGAWIYANLTLVVTLLVLIVVGGAGFGGWTLYQENLNKTASRAVYEFEKETLSPFMSEDISIEEVLNSWDDLHQSFIGRKPLLPVLLFITDELIERGENQQAYNILSEGINNFRGEYAEYFLLMRMAVVQEDLEMFDKAIKSLERLERSSLNLLGEKVYLDLGRLYMQQNQLSKARVSFEHVVNNMGQDEFVKLARIYLSMLEEQEYQSTKKVDDNVNDSFSSAN